MIIIIIIIYNKNNDNNNNNNNIYIYMDGLWFAPWQHVNGPHFVLQEVTSDIFWLVDLALQWTGVLGCLSKVCWDISDES